MPQIARQLPTMTKTQTLLLVQLMMAFTEITGISWEWHLKARPSLKYTTLGGRPTITCYNSTGTTALPRNSRWYKIASDGALRPISTDRNERVRSDGSQLRISSAADEDNGTYCCKGPTQPLDTCDKTATAHLIVVVPPVIAPGQNQTTYVGRNGVMQCVIENAGNPPFVVFRWQKSAQRLVTDGTKYTSKLIGGNIMVLTVVNPTTDDEGYYHCILETAVFQRREASVYLAVNQSSVVIVPLPNTTYTLQLYGQNEISLGMKLSIQCMVMASGSPVGNSNIQLSLALPSGEVILEGEFHTVATLEYNGTYSCIALVNGTPMVISLPVFVYAAPQPALHNDTVSAHYGSDVTLPCIVDVANPSPSYYWDRVSVEGTSSEINKTLSDGSLLLRNVQKSGMYRCTAHNYYGISIQMISLNVEASTVAKHKLLELVGTHFQSSCDQMEHGLKLSSLLEEYITNLCNCGDIAVIINVTSCSDKTALYSIQLTGVMATEAAFLVITNIQNLTKGLDLGIVVLFLQEQKNTLELHCDDQNESLLLAKTFSVTAIVIITTTVFILISIAYLRKRLTRNSQKHDHDMKAVLPLYSHFSTTPSCYLHTKV